MNNPFLLTKFYSFNTLAPALLPSSFANVQVLAIVGFDVAIMISNQNITALAAAIYPVLPSGSVSDPTMYEYVVVQSANGSKTILALDWLDLNSVVMTSSITINARISNVTLADISVINQALLQMGYNNITLTSIAAVTPTLIDILIYPATGAIAIGATGNFIAIGIYSDNSTANITNQVTWISSNTAVATINSNTAVVTGFTAGNSNVTARLNGIVSSNCVITVA